MRRCWGWGCPRDLGRSPGGSCCLDKSACARDRNVLAPLLACPEELGVTSAFGSPGRCLPVLCRHRARAPARSLSACTGDMDVTMVHGCIMKRCGSVEDPSSLTFCQWGRPVMSPTYRGVWSLFRSGRLQGFGQLRRRTRNWQRAGEDLGESERTFSHFWSPDAQCRGPGRFRGPLIRLPGSQTTVFCLSPHAVAGARELSGEPFVQALVPF